MGKKSRDKKNRRNRRAPDPIQEAIDSFKKNMKRRSSSTTAEKYQTVDKERLLQAYEYRTVELQGLIEQLVNTFRTFNPLLLMSFFSKDILLVDPRNIQDDIEHNYEAHIEYALSITTAIKEPVSDHIPEDEVYPQIKDLVVEVFKCTMHLFLLEGATYLHDHKASLIRYQGVMQHLFLRGDSFPTHHVELTKALFAHQKEFFQNSIGFLPDEIVDIFLAIIRQVEKNAQSTQRFYQQLHEAHAAFCKFVDQKEREGITDFSIIDQEYRKSEEYNRLQKIPDNFENINDSIFCIRPSQSIPQRILERLSQRIGDNRGFIDDASSSASPLAASLIYTKPLLKHDGKYYCFAPHVLHRHMKDILENWLEQGNAKQFQKYHKHRGRLLEERALGYFQALLPAAKIYHSLKYNVSQEKQCEVDGLILYDTNLLVIEAKAHAFTSSARRGSIQRIKRDTQNIVQKAYEQALRTKHYILNSDTPTFYTKSGETITIRNKAKYTNIYLINVSVENLWHLTTEIQLLQSFNFVNDGDMWSVFINDLRVIAELLDMPSEFLLYLQRRLKINQHPEISSIDELDLFGCFLQSGLYFDEIEFIEQMSLNLGSFTEQLGKYYYSPQIDGIQGEKPQFTVIPELRKFIQKIEATQKEGFSNIATSLLGMDGSAHEQFIEYLSLLIDSAKENAVRKDFVMPFRQHNWGVLVVTHYHSDLGAIEEHCRKNCYVHHVENWYLILVDVMPDNDYDVDFRIFRQALEKNPRLEQEAKELKIRRVLKYLATHKKIGRNDPCPCMSGKKYKKCCQQEIESMGDIQ